MTNRDANREVRAGVSAPRLDAATLRHVLAGYDALRSIRRLPKFRGTLESLVRAAEARESDASPLERLRGYLEAFAAADRLGAISAADALRAVLEKVTELEAGR